MCLVITPAGLGEETQMTSKQKERSLTVLVMRGMLFKQDIIFWFIRLSVIEKIEDF